MSTPIVESGGMNGLAIPGGTVSDGAATIDAPAPIQVDTPTVNTPSAPSVITDANGTLHVITPLTKKTKAIIGTIAGGVAIGLSDTLAYVPIPDAAIPYLQGVIGLAGLVALWMGISVPTNLPVGWKKTAGLK